MNCTEILRLHYQRIAAYDGKLNSLVTNIPESFKVAQQLDEYFENTGGIEEKKKDFTNK